MNLLFTSGGRRVALIQSFQQELNGTGRVLVGDVDPTAPALYVADEGVITPRVRDAQFIDQLLQIVQEKQVRALIPLIDPELPPLAAAAPRFAAAGCQILAMTPESVAVSQDKWLTAQFFTRNGIPTPRTMLPGPTGELATGMALPVVVKPRRGFSGLGITICREPEDVQAACRSLSDPLVQELLHGDEVTVDVLGDLKGRVIHVVQRQRLKIRAGEVERGVTIRDPVIERYALQAAEQLGPVGCINLQCFVTEQGPVFTEVNARFGGGYPLAQAAGANFPQLIVQMLQGKEVLPRIGQYETGVLLLRYDAAVILREKDLLHAEGRDL